MPGTKIRCAAVTPSEMEGRSEAERLREQMGPWAYAQVCFYAKK